MNSNLNRALATALAVFGATGAALAQFDLDSFCVDPNNTNPYSNPFIFELQENQFFGASIGVTGQTAYANPPAFCDGGTVIRGRIGFTIGPQGSFQDDDPNQAGSFGGVHDNFLRLTLGTNFLEQEPVGKYLGRYATPASGGQSYARIYVQTGTAAPTSYLYGSNAFSLAYTGRSARFAYTEGPVDGTSSANDINVRCVIDVLADAARVHWTLTNNLTPKATVGLGLWFGQVVALFDANGVDYRVPFGTNVYTDYITIPGRRPLTVDERFPGDVTSTVPAYCNFSMNQKAGFGLQVVNSPSVLAAFDPDAATAGTIDQTQVDEFVIGSPPFLLDGTFNAADPTFGDFLFNAPGNGNADAGPLTGRRGFPGYLQKWQPTTLVPSGNSREIVAYYRSTNFDSSYSPSFNGYSANVDTPKAISTNPAAITTPGDPSNPNAPGPFAVNPFTIRVNVDNTGGFSNSDAPVAMQSVQVILNLPQGMHTPGNPAARTVTKTINKVYPAYLTNADDTPAGANNGSRIPPQGVGYVDFPVQVDDTAIGALPYTVTITPSPGFSTKTITGTINVAATPRLLIDPGANLISPPFKFVDSSWETILGETLNSDFQAYTWDAQLQQYVTQTSAQRGVGTWIVSANDLGYRNLGGGPTQPDDEFPDPSNNDQTLNGAAPLVRLRRGWNLVGNPYNYAFPLGQLVGIPLNSNTALTYEELLSNQYTDGAFAFYDQSLKSYNFTPGDPTARLQPNRGYWLYANTDFDLQFPPLYELFIRSAPPAPFKQRFDNWKLELTASTNNGTDWATMGIARNANTGQARSVRKAPMAPERASLRINTVRATVTGTNGVDMAQVMRTARGAQSYTFSVFTKKAGPVTVSWPNLRDVPSNLAVTLTDAVTRKGINARNTSSYSFNGAAQSIRSFNVKVTPQGTVAQRVNSATTTIFRAGNTKLMRIAYSVSARGAATIRVYSGSRLVGTAASDVDVVAGSNALLWAMTGTNGLPLPNGNYTLQIAATGESGVTALRNVPVAIRR